MKIHFLPKTNLGVWSVTLAIACPILYSVGAALPYDSAYSGLEGILQNPMQTIFSLLAIASGIAAGVTALLAVLRKQERSILVILMLPALVIQGFLLIGSLIYLFTL